MKIIHGKTKLGIQYNSAGNWSCLVPVIENSSTFSFENTRRESEVNVAGLYLINFELDELEFLKKNLGPHINGNWFSKMFSKLGQESSTFDFSTSGFSLDWESRFSVVEKYLDVVNEVTQRTKELTMPQVKDHWNRRLILPLELADALSPVEYAALIENLPTDYPVQVQAKSVRHYPQKLLPLMYWVMLEVDTNRGQIICQVLIYLHSRLRAEPVKLASKKSLMRFSEESMGGYLASQSAWYRFERMEKKASQKGQTIQLSIDIELQEIAEKSLSEMVQKVGSKRILLTRIGVEL